MSDLPRIVHVEPTHDHVVRLTFTDGVIKDVDLSRFLHGRVFEPMLRNRDEFLKVFVDPESQTIAWPNGADLCPDVLYYGLTTAREEVNGAKLTEADLEFRRGFRPPLTGLPGGSEAERDVNRN